MKKTIQKKKKKTGFILLFLAALLLTGGTGYYYFFMPEEVQAISYQTGKVKQGDLTVSLENTGVIQYYNEIEVTSTASGTVSEIYVKENSDIAAGDSILRVDDTDLNFQLQQYYNDLKTAQLKLADLLQTTIDGIGKVSVDKLTTLKAPINGVVQYAVQEGMNVSTSNGLITITDKENIPFIVELFDTEVKNIKVGQKASIYPYDFMDSVTGTVEKISNTAHSNGSSLVYDVWINVKNPGMLKKGMDGRVELDIDSGIIARDGIFAEVDEVILYPSVNSKVDKIYVDNGEYVTKDTPLMKLDNTSLINQIETQKQAIKNIELKIEQLKRELDNIIVKSPDTGIINDLYVALNQNVSTSTKIAQLVSNDLVAKIEVDELDIGKVEIGQEAKLLITALSDQEITGEVVYIANNGLVKDGITTYEVYIGLERSEKIRPGMTVDVSILLAKAENTLMVQSTSIIEVKDGHAVRVLEGEQIKVKKVEVGISNDTLTQIISGIDLSDVIITSLTVPTSSTSSSSGGSSLLPSSVPIPGISGGPSGGGSGSGK